MLESIRVYITENCNANCSNCFNRNTRGKSYMSVERFEKLCAYFKENSVPQIKIMGGEPTLHPDFGKVMKIAQKYFKHVSLFTNGLNDNLKVFKPRKKDGIVYNFKFSKKFTADTLMLDKKGSRSLEIQVSEKTDVKSLMEEIKRVYSFGEHIRLNLTLDCTENIFLHRKEISDVYVNLWNQCKQNGINPGKDHVVPLCFLYGTKIPVHNLDTQCRLECTGLIDADYNLRHCNQFSEHLINMFEGDKIIPYKILINYLRTTHMELQTKILNKICKDCVFYETNCNGGCFIAKDNISREDIIRNTDFPLK
ncbi:MAG: radical SAM protein [Bacteroidales bacterium]|nr:radical SAM protein [Bacteroidales bacterium]MBR4625522.1 radical SAM protein [Alphaproteobacteria bacterium]